MPAYRPALDRFLEKIRTDPETGCWEWQARRRNGYGTFWLDGPKFAHRVAWELLVGPIPDGLTIDHLCRNKGCVRPDHLEPVPATLNTSRSHEFRERRTHCDKGHEFTPENTGWIHPSNDEPYRYCRACQLRRLKKWRNRNGPLMPPSAERTHCPSGHPYDEQNTARYADGYRVCRECRRESSRRHYAKKKASA